jgi:hypothetical protein
MNATNLALDPTDCERGARPLYLRTPRRTIEPAGEGAMFAARWHRLSLVLVSAGLLAGVFHWRPHGQTARGQTPSLAADKLFTQKILPLLEAKCLGCHGNEPNKLRGGLDLRTRTGLLAGGESGAPALVPGHPEKSRLYLAATRRDADFAMPPKASDKLSEAQLGWLREWIAAGAPWPMGAKTAWDEVKDGVAVATSGGRTPEWTDRKYRPEDIWAFQPVRRPAPRRRPSPSRSGLSAIRSTPSFRKS